MQIEKKNAINGVHERYLLISVQSNELDEIVAKNSYKLPKNNTINIKINDRVLLSERKDEIGSLIQSEVKKLYFVMEVKDGVLYLDFYSNIIPYPVYSRSSVEVVYFENTDILDACNTNVIDKAKSEIKSIINSLKKDNESI